MSDLIGRQYSGFLLESPTEPTISAEMLGCHPAMQHVGPLGATGWEQIKLVSEIPLRDEFPSQDEYCYQIICRRSGPRVLLLAEAKKVINYVIAHQLAETFSPALRPIGIEVDALVCALVEKPTLYSLTFAHAKLPAFGTSLRAASFYGEDLSDASAFRSIMPLCKFFVCGLRKTGYGSEIMRVGNDGFVMFYLDRIEKVSLVEQAFRFLRANHYLKTPILNHDDTDPV